MTLHGGLPEEWLLQPCERCEGTEQHNNAEHLEVFPVNTLNEFMMLQGENLPNHSTSRNGRGKFVQPGAPGNICFRSKQQLYRFIAYAATMAEDVARLPDEEGAHTYQEVLHAIRNA